MLLLSFIVSPQITLASLSARLDPTPPHLRLVRLVMSRLWLPLCRHRCSLPRTVPNLPLYLFRISASPVAPDIMTEIPTFRPCLLIGRETHLLQVLQTMLQSPDLARPPRPRSRWTQLPTPVLILPLEVVESSEVRSSLGVRSSVVRSLEVVEDVGIERVVSESDIVESISLVPFVSVVEEVLSDEVALEEETLSLLLSRLKKDEIGDLLAILSSMVSLSEVVVSEGFLVLSLDRVEDGIESVRVLDIGASPCTFARTKVVVMVIIRMTVVVSRQSPPPRTRHKTSLS